MFLSRLHVNLGSEPGRLWLRNMYRIHQRLCMAFPSGGRRKSDPEFLRPYEPADFPEQREMADRPRKKEGLESPKKEIAVEPEVLRHVHAPRNEDSGFLFRIDPEPHGGVVILVQSSLKPDWDYAFQNAPFLATGWELEDYDPQFTPNQRLQFRLRANPIRRACEKSRDASGKSLDAKWVGKRIPVPFDQLHGWLSRHADKSGFRLVGNPIIGPGYVYFSKTGLRGSGHRLLSVLFEGVLEVTDPVAFVKTLQAGIGSGKAFGFGLLSLAKV
jgi:CRISPR system Cascade subunit CasE